MRALDRRLTSSGSVSPLSSTMTGAFMLHGMQMPQNASPYTKALAWHVTWFLTEAAFV